MAKAFDMTTDSLLKCAAMTLHGAARQTHYAGELVENGEHEDGAALCATVEKELKFLLNVVQLCKASLVYGVTDEEKTDS